MAMSIVDNLAVALRKARKELQKEAGQIAAQIRRIEKILKSTGGTRKAGAKRGTTRRNDADTSDVQTPIVSLRTDHVHIACT